jgi:hypothetical protein
VLALRQALPAPLCVSLALFICISHHQCLLKPLKKWARQPPLREVLRPLPASPDSPWSRVPTSSSSASSKWAAPSIPLASDRQAVPKFSAASKWATPSTSSATGKWTAPSQPSATRSWVAPSPSGGNKWGLAERKRTETDKFSVHHRPGQQYDNRQPLSSRPPRAFGLAGQDRQVRDAK